MSLPRSILVAQDGGFTAPGVSDFWQPLFGTSGPFAVTRASIVFLASAIVIAWVLLRATRALTIVPSRGQMATEAIYGMVRNGLARDIIGSHDFLKFLPLLFTLFMLLLVNNLFGVVPLVQFPTASRIGIPAALTIFVFVIYHVVGIRKKGVVGYFKSLVPSGLPPGMVPPIFLLELITYFFTRPVTLALRLFGNMFAGHLLLVLFISGGEYMLLHGSPVLKIFSFGSFGMGFVMYAFEILVEFLQAYIFTLLAALYIAGSLAEEH